MNRQLIRLFGVTAVGFVLLLGFTTYWQLWAAPSLAARQDNLNEVVQEQSIDRGRILSANGEVLAKSVPRTTTDGRRIFVRRYPHGPVFAQVTGYSSPSANRSGLEQSQNDYLTGSNSDLSGVLAREFHSITGGTVKGNDVVTSLDPAVQAAAFEGLKATGHAGAAIALVPSTGQVVALASWPTYNPNAAVRGTQAWQNTLKAQGGPLLDRVTQGRYPPGSTFKVITTAAALASGKFTPTSHFVDTGTFTEYGQAIHNDSGERFGSVDLSYALTKSINTVFAQIGAQLCQASNRCPLLQDAMSAFGMYRSPQIDLPSGEVLPSGLADPDHPGRLLPRDGKLDPARTAIGQYTLEVTPLQMAMVAAAIANGGVVMQPSLVQRIVGPGGRTITTTKPKQDGHAASPEVAAEVSAMMGNVVKEGTGAAAALAGVSVAGKTGTAQTSRPGLNDAWFIAFAPQENPQIAIAVVVEDTPLYGAQAAAPIARKMIQAYLGSR
ncbi:MAG: penicillin-binding protein 2 [Gaiellales bacterium]